MIDALTELPEGHLSAAVNLIIGSSGGLSLRKGSKAVDVQITGVGTITIKGNGRFQTPSVEYRMCAYYDSDDSLIHIKYLDGAWQEITIPTAASPYAGISFDVDTTIRFAMAGDLLLIFNGTDRIACWDGTNDIAFFGAMAPTGDLTLADAGGSAALNGTYWYMYAYKNDTYGFVSSIKGPASHTTAGAQDVNITVPAKTGLDPGIDMVRIYRSIDSADQPDWSQFYFLREEAYVGAAAGPFTDTVDDTTLQGNATFYSEHPEGLFSHDLPPSATSRVLVHKGRLFAIDGSSSVYFSRQYEHAHFASGNDIEIGAGEASGIVQIQELERGPALMKHRGTWSVDTFGQPSQWRVRRLSAKGCIAPDTLKEVQMPTGPKVLMRLTLDGIAAMDSEGNDQDVSINVAKILDTVPVSYLKEFTAAWLSRDAIYAVFSPDYSILTSYSNQGGIEPPLISNPSHGSSGLRDETSGSEGVAGLLVKGIYLHLRNPAQDSKGRFIGYAPTFGTVSFEHIIDEITENDEEILGVSSFYPDQLLKIWEGWEDYTTDEQVIMPFHFTTRPLGSENKFQMFWAKKLFIRSISSTCFWDMFCQMDFGKEANLFENLHGHIADTYLGSNILKQLNPPTDLALIGGSNFTAGDHYFYYVLADTDEITEATIKTEASYRSALINIGGATTSGIQYTLPGDLTAYTKGYRYYWVFHKVTTAGAGTPEYLEFAYRRVIAMDAAGADVVYNDNGVATDPEHLLPQAYNPPAMLKWSTGGVKNVEVGVSSRFKGNYLTLTIFGDSNDPYLKFMSVGVKAKMGLIS
uniref:Uncharacterized protein n=1 Tax=viral metagenome TaxID=1070528 RepID=A0A6H1ZL93_9ZZZZ